MGNPRRLPFAALVVALVATGGGRVAAGPVIRHVPKTDALGDPLPPGCVARLGTARLRHGDFIRAAAFLPGGKQLASASNGSVRVWDVATGQLLRATPGGASWMNPALSPDGRFAALWHDEGAAVWSTETGEKLWPIPKTPIAFSYAFSPDGRTLAVGGHAGEGGYMIALYDFRAGKHLHTLRGHTNFPWSLTFSADGRQLASGGHDDTVRVWDAAAGRELRRLSLPSDSGGPAAALAFAPDGRSLVVARSRRLGLWDFDTGAVREDEPYNPHVIGAVRFTPDGKRFVVGRWNGAASVWDAKSFTKLREFPWSERDPARCLLALAPDGRTVASHFEQALALWNLESGEYVTPNRDAAFVVRTTRWSPDGSKVAAHSFMGELRIHDAATGRVQRKFDGVCGPPVAWPRAGTILTLEPLGRLAFRDDRTGQKLREFDGGNPSSQSEYRVSPDGRKFLASYSYNRMFDTESGKELFLDFPGGGSRVSFSADGKRLAAVSGDGVEVRDASTGKLLKATAPTDPARISRVDTVAFSPDGEWLALSCSEPERAADADGPRQIVRLLEIKTGKVRHAVPERPTRHGWHALAVSPDGRLVAGTTFDDPRIHLWDLATNRELPPAEGHAGSKCWVRALAFSPDGKQLLSTADDGTALVWDVAALVNK
jgi:WD40 repeat protein